MGKKGEMSKKKNTGIDSNNPDSRAKKQKVRKTHKTFKQAYRDSKERVWDKKRARVKLHHSFKRSYREEYERPLAAPGLVSHTFTTFKIIFHNWKLFGLLLFFTVFANVILVGVLSESSYKTLQESIDISAEYNGVGELGRFAKSAMLLISSISTGGLSTSLTDVQAVLLVFIVASLWLITTYYLRHLLAGNKPRFRDGLYNALSPLISVFAVFLVMFVHLIPLFITIIVYSVALQTEFLSQPFYAFLFFVFAALLLTLSLYLLPVSLVALSAVTVPGIYPMAAIHAATDVMQGRRIKYIIRVLYLLFVLAVLWIVIMIPIVWLDLILKENFEIIKNVPFVPIALQAMICFSIIYGTSYLYLFYRRMLDDRH